MGDGGPSPSLIESWRVLGGSEVRGYVCWEWKLIQRGVVRVSDVIGWNESQVDADAIAAAVTMP